MTHWSGDVSRILSSKVGDLKELAALAGEDWRVLYRHQSLAGCNLEGQDLRGLDLTGCHIDKAKIDAKTLIDPQFDPRPSNYPVLRNFRFHQLIDDSMTRYAKKANYFYLAWAYKSIMQRASHYYKINQDKGLFEAIQKSENLKILSMKRSGQPKVVRRFQVERYVIETAMQLQVDFQNNDGPSMLVLSGLINNFGLDDLVLGGDPTVASRLSKGGNL